MTDRYSQIEQGTGELLTYPDPFAGIDQQVKESFDEFENEVLTNLFDIETSLIKLGYALSAFKSAEAYKGLGYTSFKLWCQDPTVDLTVKQANDLIRIVEEVLPKLESMDRMLSTIKLKMLLPLLNEDIDILMVAELIQDMTVSDAKATIKELRGIEDKVEKAFKAYVKKEPNWNEITIVYYGENDTYTVTNSGPMHIKSEHMAEWTSRFGRFIEYSND